MSALSTCKAWVALDVQCANRVIVEKAREAFALIALCCALSLRC